MLNGAAPQQVVLVDSTKCTGCKICAKVCPVNVFDIVDKKSVPTRASKCMACQLCEVECPFGAVTVPRTAAKAASPGATKPSPATEAAQPPPSRQPSPSPTALATARLQDEEPERPTAPSRSSTAKSEEIPKRADERGAAGESPAVAPTRPVPAVHVFDEADGQERDASKWEYPSFEKPSAAAEVDGPAQTAEVVELEADRPGRGRKILTAFPDLCVNCRMCELVCSLKHTGEFNPFKSCVKVTYSGTVGPYTPTICRHCQKAACEAACPTGALYYEDRVVLLDRAKCISCLECVRACPFGAVQVGPQGEIYKCDLCGGEPACAKYCPPRPENTAGRLAHPKASAIQYVEPHNVSAMKRVGLASSKK